MSTELQQSQAQADTAAAPAQTTHGDAPALQDVLAESTLAMLGGAPQAEVQRLDAEAKAHLTKASSPASAHSPAALKNEQNEQNTDQAPDADPASEQPLEAADRTDGSPLDDNAEPAEQTGDTSSANADGTAPPTSAPDAAKDPKAAERFRFSAAADKAVALIAKAKGISLVDAARVYAGEPGAATAGAQAAPAQDPAPMPVSPNVAQLEAQVARLERQLDESGGTGGLWNGRVSALVKQHSRTSAALEVARLTAAQAAVEHQAFEAQRDAALADTVKQFPDLGNQDSALWKVAAQLAREAHDPASPDHEAGQQIDAPRHFAARAAKLLNLQPVSVRSSVPSVAHSAAARTAPRPGPASGTRQTLPPAPAPSLQQQIADVSAKTLAMIGGKKGLRDDDDGMTILVV
jgi:hypothetical protein